MKLRKLIAMLLVATMLVSVLAVVSLAASWTQTVSVTTADSDLYGSRYSTNRDDYFAEAEFVEQETYIMPDEYNTGHVTAFDDLVDFGTKYPEVPKSVDSGDGSVTYTIDAAAARKYNYVFEGFKIIHGSISITTQGETVVIRDFYIDGAKTVGSLIWTPRKIEINGHPNRGELFNGRAIVLDGELIGSTQAQITGFNITMRRCYLHHCQADHVKGFTGQIFVGNLFTAGGLNGGNPHPDCIQYSVDDGHGKGLDTENVFVYGNRFDTPITAVNKTNSVVILKSEFTGGVRNFYFCKNWVNGGGAAIQIHNNNNTSTGGGPMKFYENINFCDNIFGNGESYKNRNIDCGTDYDGVSFSKKINATGNITVNTLHAGSVNYYSDGVRVDNLADVTGKLSVKTVIANYLTSAKNIILKVDIVDANGASIASKFVTSSIAKYPTYAEYTKFENYNDFRYADLPVHEEYTLTFNEDLNLTEGCQAQVTVFMEHPSKALELIRKDNITYGDAALKNIPVAVPEGYTIYDTDANSPSNLFKKAVNACKNKEGDALRAALIEAASYYPEIDENIDGVTAAKEKFNQYIEAYNLSISENNVLMEQGLEITAKFTGISEWFRDIFESFFAFVRRLFAWA